MKTRRMSVVACALFALSAASLASAQAKGGKEAAAAHRHADHAPHGHGSHGDHHDGHQTLPAGRAVDSASLYQLERDFIDAKGKAIRLSSFEGKPVLISMFYATCPHACPLLISDIKRLEQQLPEKERARLQVVLVTLVPERDTPEGMAKLLASHGVDGKRWQALQTGEEGVRELAGLLGIKYRFTKDGAINHSSVITLLDERGVIRERIEGLRQPPDRVVRALTARN